ncbi:MAG: hypothetical protein ACE5HZ_05910 [Fidelibacterota bacterium]
MAWLVLVFVFAGPLKPESIWVQYGNQLFQEAGDARSVALSGSEVASATGPLSILWNPSRLQAPSENVVVYAHQERFSKAIIYDIIGFNLKESSKSKLAFALIREAVDGIPDTREALRYGFTSLDEPGARIVSSRVVYFNQVQWAGLLGMAQILGEWKVGGSAKVLVHRLGEYSGYGIGFDVGAYRDLTPRTTVGFAVRDATTSWVVWDSGTVERMAPRVHLGARSAVVSESLNLTLNVLGAAIVNLAGRTRQDSFRALGAGGHFRWGMDVRYKENFHVRAGLNPLSGYSLGLGLGFPFGQVDYAYAPHSLGTSHYVSLNLRVSFLHSLKEKMGG